MEPGVGKLDMFPSIWGRKYFHLVSFTLFRGLIVVL